MMEGNLLCVLAIMGFISLYIVIATVVGRGIYSVTRRWDENERVAAAIIGGVLFPISVPIILVIVWIWSIASIPLRIGEDQSTDTEECSQELSDVRERVRTLERRENVAPSDSAPKPKPKFRVGDLITGINGNPGRYKHLYEGCVCRILEVDGEKPMKVVLVNHMDFDAHKDSIGEVFTAPQRYFTLIKPTAKKESLKSTKKPAKKVAKKK